MTHRKSREPDDRAERACKTEGIKVTPGGYRVALVGPSGPRFVSSTYETLDEVALKSTPWLNKGYSGDPEEVYCWTITLTG